MTASLDEITLALIRGDLDNDLTALEQAIRARRAVMPNAFKVGDRVRLNSNVSPKYLVGALATVTKVNQKSIKVTLDKKQGRFGTAPIKCPLAIVDKVEG